MRGENDGKSSDYSGGFHQIAAFLAITGRQSHHWSAWGTIGLNNLVLHGIIHDIDLLVAQANGLQFVRYEARNGQKAGWALVFPDRGNGAADAKCNASRDNEFAPAGDRRQRMRSCVMSVDQVDVGRQSPDLRGIGCLDRKLSLYSGAKQLTRFGREQRALMPGLPQSLQEE
jgi:hypothetical protein